MGSRSSPGSCSRGASTGSCRRPASSRSSWLVGVGAGLTGPPCDVETAYFCARVETDPDRPSGRSLWLDNLRHAYVDLDDPTVLESRYVRLFADVVEDRADGPLDVLHIGGGGFTFPRYLAHERPGSDQTVLEIDDELPRIARDRLGLSDADAADFDIRIGDARLALDDFPRDRFDLVVGDAFASQSVPWHLTTSEVAAELDRILRDDGIYVMNVIDGGDNRFARAELATLAEHFTHVAAIRPPDDGGDPGRTEHGARRLGRPHPRAGDRCRGRSVDERGRAPPVRRRCRDPDRRPRAGRSVDRPVSRPHFQTSAMSSARTFTVATADAQPVEHLARHGLASFTNRVVRLVPVVGQFTESDPEGEEVDRPVVHERAAVGVPREAVVVPIELRHQTIAGRLVEVGEPPSDRDSEDVGRHRCSVAASRQDGSVPPDTLSDRALNRATLARQHLLERSDLGVLETVRHLVGMQAQLPLGPYLSLWSRLAGFDPDEVGRLLEDRRMVRIVVMRSTIHLVTAGDCLEMRPIFQPVMEREMASHAEHAPKLVGIDLDAVVAAGRRAMAEEPLTGPQLRMRARRRGFPTTTPPPWSSPAGSGSPWCRCRPAGCGGRRRR